MSSSVSPDSAESQPIAPVKPPSDSIDNYRPKKQIGWLIVIGAMVVAGLVGGIILATISPSQPVQTPTPPRPTYTPTQTGGLPFADSLVSGHWQVTSSDWLETGIRLIVELSLDEDSLPLYCVFYAYADEDRIPHEPATTPSSGLQSDFVGPGEKVTIQLFFELSRQDITLILMGRGQAQLSALSVPG